MKHTGGGYRQGIFKLVTIIKMKKLGFKFRIDYRDGWSRKLDQDKMIPVLTYPEGLHEDDKKAIQDFFNLMSSYRRRKVLEMKFVTLKK